MKKRMIAVFVSLLLTLTACAGEQGVLSSSKTYEVSSGIHSLDIRLNAADFEIVEADGFSVESNLKYLSVSEKNGILVIEDKARGGLSYTDAALKLYIPRGTVFREVEIATGAAKLTVEVLSTDKLELNLGAGDVRFAQLDVTSDAEIEGGAGQITVESGSIRNLTLEMGVGELNLTAALLGNSDLEFGVGESNVTLLGSAADYRVSVEKGIGSVCIDGKDASGFSGGNGQNRVEIEGGIGAVNIAFRAE